MHNPDPRSDDSSFCYHLRFPAENSEFSACVRYLGEAKGQVADERVDRMISLKQVYHQQFSSGPNDRPHSLPQNEDAAMFRAMRTTMSLSESIHLNVLAPFAYHRISPDGIGDPVVLTSMAPNDEKECTFPGAWLYT